MPHSDYLARLPSRHRPPAPAPVGAGAQLRFRWPLWQPSCRARSGRHGLALPVDPDLGHEPDHEPSHEPWTTAHADPGQAGACTGCALPWPCPFPGVPPARRRSTRPTTLPLARLSGSAPGRRRPGTWGDLPAGYALPAFFPRLATQGRTPHPLTDGGAGTGRYWSQQPGGPPARPELGATALHPGLAEDARDVSPRITGVPASRGTGCQPHLVATERPSRRSAPNLDRPRAR